MNQAITVQDVSVRKDDVVILNHISATLAAGEITGILGPSGAGKTTLMRVIVGLQKPNTGTVTVMGTPAGSPELRRNIGYMTQALSVYPDISLQENMQFFAAMTDTSAARTSEVLQEVDLLPQAKQLVATLSGGQQSRVSLAIALLAKPKLLVLDEPTVGLDPVLRRRLWQLFFDLKAQGTTILVTSHAMDEAAQCDSLLLLRNGQVLAQGSPSALMRRTKTDNPEAAFIKLVRSAQ